MFYEIREENLSLYIDLGLSLRKLGEEAIVPLEAFSLEGSNRRGLRRVQRDVLKAGASFTIVPAEDVGAMLPDMRRVSDQWLAGWRAGGDGRTGWRSPPTRARGPGSRTPRSW